MDYWRQNPPTFSPPPEFADMAIKDEEEEEEEEEQQPGWLLLPERTATEALEDVLPSALSNAKSLAEAAEEVEQGEQGTIDGKPRPLLTRVLQYNPPIVPPPLSDD